MLISYILVIMAISYCVDYSNNMKRLLWIFLITSLTLSSAHAIEPLKITVTRTSYAPLLMEQLSNTFRDNYPTAKLEIAAFGSLKVMDEARKGNADIIITYYPPEELRLLKDGVVNNRIEFMHSSYVLLGPPGDELGLLKAANAQQAVKILARNEAPFVTSSPRGGTYQKIADMWKSADIKPDWPWYEIADTTPLGSMRLAAEQEAYTIADFGEYLLNQKELSESLVPLYQGDYALRKPFSVMQINTERFSRSEHPLAKAFVDYLVSDEGQKILLASNKVIFNAQVLVPAAHFDPGIMALRAKQELVEKSRNLNLVTGLLLALLLMFIITVYLLSRTKKSRKEQISAEIARSAAERSNVEKTKFLSRISHELRTPMNAVLGFTQLLLLSEGDVKKKDSLNEVLAAGKHLQNLIDDILDVSMLERDKVKIRLTDVDVDDQLSECIRLLDEKINKKNLTVKVLGDNHLKVYVDETRFKQVLINLLSNAVKYNSDNGVITINVERIHDSNFMRVSITDTGKGLSDKQKQSIFTPFERLGAENTTIEGTGMGLVICKKYVELMYGVIGFESEEDKGSTFWVEFTISERLD